LCNKSAFTRLMLVSSFFSKITKKYEQGESYISFCLKFRFTRGDVF